MLRQQPPSFIRDGFVLSRLSIVAVLLLISHPSFVLGQGCGPGFTACTCGANLIACVYATYHPGECVWEYQGCMTAVPPDSPPAAPGSPAPSGGSCAAPQIARGPGQARVTTAGVRPRDSSGSGGMFIDPVPDLQRPDGSGITTNQAILGDSTKGTPVQGAAADSASRVVLRIPACKKGKTLQVTVLNTYNGDPDELEAAPKGDPADVGTLSSIGGSEKDSELTVTANWMTKDGQAMAFAVYRPPEDFVRQHSPDPSDSTAKSRAVYFRVKPTDSDKESDISVDSFTLLRPPVVFVHGLWDDPIEWNTFPLYSQQFWKAMFSSRKASYNVPLTNPFIVSAPMTAVPNSPSYPATLLKTEGNVNQLGFDFAAPFVTGTIQEAITDFRGGANAEKVPAAAAQADVVGHSMGGLVARQITRADYYLSEKSSFLSGNIHKIITIATPHFGSPLANLLFQDQCAANALAYGGYLVLGTPVQLSDGTITHGAVYDLQGAADGSSGGVSLWLSILNGGQVVPVAEVAGKYSTQDPALGGTFLQLLTRTAPAYCYLSNLGHPSPLLQYTGPGAWKGIFNNQDNDALVSKTSALAGRSAGEVRSVTDNVIHAGGYLKLLGFQTSTPELESQDTSGGSIAGNVMYLLNASVACKDSGFCYFREF